MKGHYAQIEIKQANGIGSVEVLDQIKKKKKKTCDMQKFKNWKEDIDFEK